MLLPRIPDVWLGQGETIMEANCFWHSWLSVCFHGKAYSLRHELSPTASDCSPVDPSLVKFYFEISMWDLCFDSRVSNVTLRWSSRGKLKSFRITIARIVHHGIKQQQNLLSDLELWLCVAATARSLAHSVTFHLEILKENAPYCPKSPF